MTSARLFNSVTDAAMGYEYYTIDLADEVCFSNGVSVSCSNDMVFVKKDDKIVRSIGAYRRHVDVVAREALKEVERLGGLVKSTFDPDAPIVIRG